MDGKEYLGATLMSRTTPEEAFIEAQAAMERGDWEGFFVCFVPDNLSTIAENGVARFLVGGEYPVFDTICAANGIPATTMRELRDHLAQISESASHPDYSDTAKMVQHSARHRLKVQAYQKALKDMIKAVPDLSRFVAGLERALRAETGGGSVSAKLFVEETLENVSIKGTKAWAKRRTREGHTEDVGFVKGKGGWYIHLFARPPASKR